MPLVRIDLPAGKPAAYRQTVAEVIYTAMIDILKVPENDRFQVISQHDAANLIIDPNYLGIQRTADAILVQVTLNEGRSVELKKSVLQKHRGWVKPAYRPATGRCFHQPDRSKKRELVIRQWRGPVRIIVEFCS
jgi:phenylpyruvate tautomerase PptA (4-oxalocrotonate tautomerase family)